MKSNKIKVLVFIDWFLPGYKAGGPTRSLANMIDFLHDHIDFYVVTRSTDYLQTISYPQIETDCWLKKFNATIYYISPQKLNAALIKSIIKTSDCEIIYTNGIYSFYFSILPLFYSRNKKQLVATRGMLANTAIEIKSLKKNLFLKLAGIFGLYQHVTFHATNTNERNDIKSLFKNNKVLVASNFPKKNKQNDFILKPKQVGQLRLFSLARISPEKNLLFALQVLAQCKQTIFFTIYGAIYNTEYWQECQQIIAKMPANITIEYKNEIVPELVNSTIANYHFLFLPTLGENFGHAIFESFTAGVPVIISDKTPWRNLEEKKAGFDIPLQNQLDFVQRIENLALMNAENYNTFSKQAFFLAKNFIDNEQVKQDNLNLFQHLLT